MAAAPDGGMEAFISPALQLSGMAAMQQRRDFWGNRCRVGSPRAAGRVLGAHIVRSVHPFLDGMVRDAILRTKWTPAFVEPHS